MVPKEDIERVQIAALNLGAELLNVATKAMAKVAENLPGEALRVKSELDKFVKNWR